MPDPTSLLAIVVPAYKAAFLAEALSSIAAQTDQRFRLYVCDDASPENLEPIFRAARLPATATFHRFERNLGRCSLVESWARAVALSTEPWVWLFSDDDLMDPGCVAAFHQALEKDGDAFNVYRFNVLVIDEKSRVTHIQPPGPELESTDDFIFHRLARQRMSTAPEYIFRRHAYEQRGGFVDFPFGLGSDDATWINLVGPDTFFRGISGPRVCWRWSGINISARAGDYAAKTLGMLAYATWLYALPGGSDQGTVGGRPATFRRYELVRRWFLGHLHRAPHWFTRRECQTLADACARELHVPKRTAWFFLLRSNFFFVLDRARQVFRSSAA